MSKLNYCAKETLRGAGITQAAWIRAGGWIDGKWHGDECGCTDDRCIGYHHDADEECQCLPAMLLDIHQAPVRVPVCVPAS